MNTKLCIKVKNVQVNVWPTHKHNIFVYVMKLTYRKFLTRWISFIKEMIFICFVNASEWIFAHYPWVWTSWIGLPCQKPKMDLQHNTCPGWDDWPGVGCQCLRRTRVHWTRKSRGSYRLLLWRYEQNEVETCRERYPWDEIAADQLSRNYGEQTLWTFLWLTHTCSIEDCSHVLSWMFRWNGSIQRGQRIWSDNRLYTRVCAIIVSPWIVGDLFEQQQLIVCLLQE